MNCLSCKHYLETAPKNGMCRRFPPTAVAVKMDQFGIQSAGIYPPVGPADWCGEYAVKILG